MKLNAEQRKQIAVARDQQARVRVAKHITGHRSLERDLRAQGLLDRAA